MSIVKGSTGRKPVEKFDVASCIPAGKVLSPEALSSSL